jgi:2-oxoglutarate dehydrogenase E1 component
MDDRKQMGEGTQSLDWGMAENLAYASLLSDGVPVRLTGQDSGRGTFFHRHAVLHDQNRERWDAGVFIPLQHLIPGQANFLVIDSLLIGRSCTGIRIWLRWCSAGSAGYLGGAIRRFRQWSASCY